MATRGRGRPRDAGVEDAVLQAVIAEISEKGLDATTMEGIAARAGIGKATLYRRWPNKLALLHFLADQLSTIYEPDDTGELRKDLLSVFEPFAAQSYDGPLAVLAPIFIAAAAHDEQMRAFLTTHVKARRAGAALALRRAQRRGELRADVNINVTVDMIAGALSERSYQLREPVNSTYVRKVVDQAIAGIVER